MAYVNYCDKDNQRSLERSGAMVKRRIQDRELAGSTLASTSCVLEQGTLSTLLVSAREDLRVVLSK